MQNTQLQAYRRWLTDYISGFYENQDTYVCENIRLKEDHTHRVCKEMRDLAQAIKLPEADAVLAEAVALFHDIGRFRQFTTYRTYKDNISTNHCLLGLQVLRETGILADLDAEDRRIIETTVEFHGVKELPALDERAMQFAQMIRDVDKIDIYHLLVKNYRILADKPENFKWEVEFPDAPECNPEIIRELMAHQRIDYNKIRTINDAKLLQLGWVFDISFEHSLRRIYDRGYLHDIIAMMPQTGPIKTAADHVLEWTRQRLSVPEEQNSPIYIVRRRKTHE